MSKNKTRLQKRQRRKVAIRKRLRGATARPRLSVFRSNQHIYAQIINDDTGATLVSASTQSAELKAHEGHLANMEAAKAVGALLATKAKAAKIGTVVFDRNGYLYHGRVQALADAAREGGLDF